MVDLQEVYGNLKREQFPTSTRISPFLSQQGSIVADRRTGGSYGGKGDLSLFRESGF